MTKSALDSAPYVTGPKSLSRSHGFVRPIHMARHCLILVFLLCGCLDSFRRDRAVVIDVGPGADMRAWDPAFDVGPIPGLDAGPDPDAGPLESNRDPRPITLAEAECMGLTDPACASCHELDGRWFLFPYWAPAEPEDYEVVPPAPDPSCSPPPRTNRLSDEAIDCFGLDAPSCIGCHSAAGDGEVYLRPWGNVPASPGVPPADPACYELLQDPI